jgi:Lon protease-like protein|tara:strand:- start:77 stop:382 length:306 start_codon:yes stop_codon:yes gene_type:complete
MVKRGVFDDPEDDEDDEDDEVDPVVDEALPQYTQWIADNPEPPFPGRVAPSVDNYETMQRFEIALTEFDRSKATWDDWNNRKEEAERLTERGWSNTAQGNP